MRWLIDELLPLATAEQLKEHGHDALSVADAGLASTDDAVVYQAAVDQDRVMVTENFADFSVVVTQRLAGEKPCVPLVFVRKKDYPRGGALAFHLHDWAAKNPDPYPGPHWP